MKTKSSLGGVRGMRSCFTYPCKIISNLSGKLPSIFDSFHQITIKNKQICSKNTHIRNALWNEILSKPCENSMACGIHLFANAFPNPFGDHLRPNAQHANVSAPKRASVPCNVPACLKMFLPAPKL